MTELVDKLDELVKSDERWKGCGLPEKYKHFLINYTDSYHLGKYDFFANFDLSLDQLMSEQRYHHKKIRKQLKRYEPVGESDELEEEFWGLEVPKKRYRKLIPWFIADNGYFGRHVGQIAEYFIDLNHSSTASNDLPVYRKGFGGNVCITKAYSDINDFLTVARLQAKPVQQIRKRIKKLDTIEKKLKKVKIENNEQKSKTTN